MPLFSLLKSICTSVFLCILRIVVCACVCVYMRAAPTAALFINTSVGLHSGREREPRDSLGQRPRKKITRNLFPRKLESARSHLTKSSRVNWRRPPTARRWNPIPVLLCRPAPGLAEKTQRHAEYRRHSLMASADVLFLIALPTPASFPTACMHNPACSKPAGLYQLLFLYLFFVVLRGLHMPSRSFPLTPTFSFLPLLSLTFPLFISTLLLDSSPSSFWSHPSRRRKAWAQQTFGNTSFSHSFYGFPSLCPFLTK